VPLLETTIKLIHLFVENA